MGRCCFICCSTIPRANRATDALCAGCTQGLKFNIVRRIEKSQTNKESRSNINFGLCTDLPFQWEVFIDGVWVDCTLCDEKVTVRKAIRQYQQRHGGGGM